MAQSVVGTLGAGEKGLPSGVSAGTVAIGVECFLINT
jgi:hypothetical protein